MSRDVLRDYSVSRDLLSNYSVVGSAFSAVCIVYPLKSLTELAGFLCKESKARK